MTLPVGFDPAALEELHAVERWYRRENPEVAAEFLVEAWRAIDEVAGWPGASPLVDGPSTNEDEIRRARLDRFPYGIVYLVLDDMLLIVAVAHNSRRPGYWHDRLR